MIKVAWRGVVVDGVVWAWPTLLLEHNEAFVKFSYLKDYTCRWRQWDADSAPDFDVGASAEDKQLVNDWLKKVQS